MIIMYLEWIDKAENMNAKQLQQSSYDKLHIQLSIYDRHDPKILRWSERP